MQFGALRPENERFYVFMVHPGVMLAHMFTCNGIPYESFPAETMVDGLPRARSVNTCHHDGPCSDLISSKKNVLEPGRLPGGSAIKRYTE